LVKHSNYWPTVLKILFNFSSGAFHTSLYIYFAWASVCLSVSNKRKNGWTDRAQILCWISHDPREGSRMLKITKICVKSFWVLLNFENARNNISKSTNFFVIVLKCTKMLTDRSTIKSWNVRTLVFYNWLNLLQIANLSFTRYYTLISETHLFWIIAHFSI